MTVARCMDNQCKNRYRDISPYDSTRVVLKDCASGDYVNASFVNMEIPESGIINRYIATQGPLPTTCEEFWVSLIIFICQIFLSRHEFNFQQMVWEQNCPLIVMVTPLVERGRSKCHKYWPDLDQTETYGDNLKIINMKETGTCPMVERTIKLICLSTNEERKVIQIQYLAWPDHGVPDDPGEFLDLMSKVRLNRPSMDRPIIVHCRLV